MILVDWFIEEETRQLKGTTEGEYNKALNDIILEYNQF